MLILQVLKTLKKGGFNHDRLHCNFSKLFWMRTNGRYNDCHTFVLLMRRTYRLPLGYL